MNFSYLGDTKDALTAILGGTADFEKNIQAACGADAVTDVAVHPLTPGLSGAAVFHLHRTGGQTRFIEWIAKVASDAALINEERRNNDRIAGKLQTAPRIIVTKNPKLLVFVFGGFLRNPSTLRSGYAKSDAAALSTLMSRIVTYLHPLHESQPDGVSCLDRMPRAATLAAELPKLATPLRSDVAARLIAAWDKAIADKDAFPKLVSTGHGDMNAGNVLFEAGNGDSYPIFIDFASIKGSKDSVGFNPYFHLPFWDYAKIERDLQTRCFLLEAIAASHNGQIVQTLRAINGAAGETAPLGAATTKLLQVTQALRAAIRPEHPPADFDGAYRAVLAYAMLSVLFREVPDSNVPQSLQNLAAAEAGCALLEAPRAPFPALAAPPVAPTARTPLRVRAANLISVLRADEQKLVARIFRFEGRCSIAHAKGEDDTLWVPGPVMDMEWGIDRVGRMNWLGAVESLVAQGVLVQMTPQPREISKFYELTDVGWEVGLLLAGDGATD